MRSVSAGVRLGCRHSRISPSSSTYTAEISDRAFRPVAAYLRGEAKKSYLVNWFSMMLRDMTMRRGLTLQRVHPHCRPLVRSAIRASTLHTHHVIPYDSQLIGLLNQPKLCLTHHSITNPYRPSRFDMTYIDFFYDRRCCGLSSFFDPYVGAEFLPNRILA
jgi:hypothetical protein